MTEKPLGGPTLGQSVAESKIGPNALQPATQSAENPPATAPPRNPQGAPRKRPPAPTVPPAIDHLIERLLLLGVLLGLIHFWAQRHLSISLLEEVEGAPLIAVLLPFLVTLLDFFGGKSETKGFQTWLRTKAIFVLKTPVLGLLYLVVLVIGSMLSSVTVLEADTHGPLQVTVRKEAALNATAPGGTGGRAAGASKTKTLEEEREAVRFLCWSNPFGRTCVVEVEGFQPYSFDLYPWIGKRVRVARDLEFAPSVLIRVPLGRHSQLPAGRIELWSAGKRLAETNTAELRGSALFGRELPLEGRLTDWEHELRLAGAEGKAFSGGYLAWRRPLVVALKTQVVAGMKLEALFLARNGEKQASAKFTVSSEPLQDILLSEERN